MNLHTLKKSVNKTNYNRFIELDVLRGFAIAIMIICHLLWDLNYYGLVPLNNGIYHYSRIFPSIFFLLVGICLAISTNKKQTLSEQTKHLLIRGSWIFILGMALTSITLIVVPDKTILFGALHCIGLSIILSIPFLKFKSYNIVFAAAIMVIGLIVGSITVENPSLLHLVIGFHQPGIWKYTIDYFPLLPWFGIILVGIALGNFLYKDNKRRFKIPDLSKYRPITLFSWLGQHSLIIYLLHQPIMAGALLIFIII
ncbi:MAG: DUF1624 domain-containing protein [Thermoplasmatales archaeon]|nr:MAG: DUF1624 domain-containing protein [Thermoplasmatales archaeon]